MNFDFIHWNTLFENKAKEIYPNSDPSHDFLHITRVVKTALQLTLEESAKIEVVLPAAYFHDFVNVPKNDPRRSQASRISAQEALKYLQSVQYPSEHFPEIQHAIEAHSFSANIETQTIEAKIVQDSDRLDSLGAIGTARLFATSTSLHRPFYDLHDPWHLKRDLDDYKFAVDHFYVKLFKLVSTLKTQSGRNEGEKRANFMQTFLEQLRTEIS